jgi:hypothetical protein
MRLAVKNGPYLAVCCSLSLSLRTADIAVQANNPLLFVCSLVTRFFVWNYLSEPITQPIEVNFAVSLLLIPVFGEEF